jgi:hypothetical protein
MKLALTMASGSGLGANGVNFGLMRHRKDLGVSRCEEERRREARRQAFLVRTVSLGSRSLLRSVASATVVVVWGAKPGAGKAVSRFVSSRSASMSGVASSHVQHKSQFPGGSGGKQKTGF